MIAYNDHYLHLLGTYSETSSPRALQESTIVGALGAWEQIHVTNCGRLLVD